MAHLMSEDTPRVLRVLNQLHFGLAQYNPRSLPLEDLGKELDTLIDIVRLLFNTPTIDVTASALENSLDHCASTLEAISTSLFGFASQKPVDQLPLCRPWPTFSYKTLSIADCDYIVRGFKSGFQLALAEAAPDIATSVGLRDTDDYDAARGAVDYLKQTLGSWGLLESHEEPLRAPSPSAVGETLLPSRSGCPPQLLVPSAVQRYRLPTGRNRSVTRRFCTEDVTLSGNTLGMNVEVFPTSHRGDRTNRLAKVDASVEVACKIDGFLWEWEGPGKHFLAAWKSFVAREEVSPLSIGKLRVNGITLPASVSTVAEGELRVMSTDAVAIVEAVFACYDLGKDSDPKLSPDVAHIRQRRLAKFAEDRRQPLDESCPIE